MHLAAGPLPVEQAQGAGGLHAEHDVLGDREHRNQHEVLVDHPDPGVDRVLRRVDRHRLAVDADLPVIRLHQPVQDVHQRGLAGPVLAEQAADLAGSDLEVDVVVGHEAAEALRDPAQLKFHGRPSYGCSRDDRRRPARATLARLRPAR